MVKNGIGFVLHFYFLRAAMGLHFGNRIEKFLIFAVEAGLISIEKCKRRIGAGERVKGECDAIDFLEVFQDSFDVVLVPGHLIFQQGGFDSGVADDAPVRGGELADEIEFGFADRLEVSEIVIEFRFVFGGGLFMSTTVLAVSPWVTALRAAADLPAGVFGPVDFWPLARAESSLRWDDILVSFEMKVAERGGRGAGGLS